MLRSFHPCARLASVLLVPVLLASALQAGEADVEFPLGRHAYFLGEQVPLGLTTVTGPVLLEAVGKAGATEIYRGPAQPLWLDTSSLAPGKYQLKLNGKLTGQLLTVTSVLRPSPGALVDEAVPDAPWGEEALRESGISACVALGSADCSRLPVLETMTPSGALLLVNPDTRPTSFYPTGNAPWELEGMSQRMILTAQANGRYPSFGGFCFGWDTAGYAIGQRKSLMVYWGWGDQTGALRHYIARVDRHTREEFTRRTGLAPVGEAEYISYLLSIKHPELAPAIDLPTRVWLMEIAEHAKPMDRAQLAQFEKRLDAWSGYLMSLYREAYSTFASNLRSVDPALRNTGSVQIDHCAVGVGQYFPRAYEPLDFQYQTTWNDQVGGPDYAYQWLLTYALLEMHRGARPTWISSCLGATHERCSYPGKMTRVAAHGLAFGGSGIGFALEGFSTVLGGMNEQTRWPALRGKAGEMDLRSGRDFLHRFACLAVEGRGDHGVGILFSRSQYQRQQIVQGFGTTPYKALLTLTRLGYTPRFVTEEDLTAGKLGGIRALVVLGQTFPVSSGATAALERFVKDGGTVFADQNTVVPLPAARKLPVAMPFTQPGKPHNWTAPNLVGNDNDSTLAARWYAQLAPIFSKALGPIGQGLLTPVQGKDSQVTLLQIDGGKDAKYVVAVNDSSVRNQADWYQVREKLVPTAHADVGTVVYDVSEERLVGKMAPFECDLTATTARVYGILARPVARLELSARQRVRAGEEVVIRVRFLDEKGKVLQAVIPVHLSLKIPDGQVYQAVYRSTDRQGDSVLGFSVPANAPAGMWQAAVRCQLAGQTASLPIEVTAAPRAVYARGITEPVVARQRDAVEQALMRGQKVVLPLFDSALAPEIEDAAKRIQQTLAGGGVEVQIRRRPVLGTYTIAYDLTAHQKRENEQVERGEVIGQIKRLTVNGNDWESALSGYRFGQPLILLDVAGKNTNPMVAALEKAGILWPSISPSFPGKGRAVIQAVPWAFAPRRTTIVIQASDVAGLVAAAGSLARLPEDQLTPHISRIKRQLWQQYHIGGKPATPRADGLTSRGVQLAAAPQPFSMPFPNARPPAAAQVHPAPEAPHPATAIPATFLPKQYVLFQKDGEKWIETATADFLTPDLRFSQGVRSSQRCDSRAKRASSPMVCSAIRTAVLAGRRPGRTFSSCATSSFPDSAGPWQWT